MPYIKGIIITAKIRRDLEGIPKSGANEGDLIQRYIVVGIDLARHEPA